MSYGLVRIGGRCRRWKDSTLPEDASLPAADTLTQHQLVRHIESRTRWCFAKVCQVREAEVELTFFDGTTPRGWVPRTAVESLETFLRGRERVWSRTRTQLTSLFFGQSYDRLPAERLRSMQQTLRRAGIDFTPREWQSPQTKVQLWLDRGIVPSTSTDPRLTALLPQWLEPFVLPSGSRDPLGLQGPAERLVNEVLPGLTVFTSRAGYYGFLSWAIRTVNALPPGAVPPRLPRREILNALERALALCEFAHHGMGDDSCPLIGQRSKLRVLSAHTNGRFRVPDSILKNQNSAGSFRLFATSLVSLGLVEEADELAADGLLPFRLTARGDRLASAFQARVDAPALLRFALGTGTQPREAIQRWGSDLCFSSLAKRAAFRGPLLEGLLRGNNRDAEKRYRTVALLYDAGLSLTSNNSSTSEDAVNELEAVTLEDGVQGTGLSNLDVVLHFYGRTPSPEIRALQQLAVFELLSLGFNALFRAAVVSVAEGGTTDITGLTRSISSVATHETLWQAPMIAAKPPTVRHLTRALLKCEDPVEGAAIGGLLLLRLLRDSLLSVVWETLATTAREPMAMIDQGLRAQMQRSLAEVLPALLLKMVAHHEVVSQRKSRQRWLFAEGNVLLRDDIQTMGLGLHALRFPQLGSLARDLDLVATDLRHG